MPPEPPAADEPTAPSRGGAGAPASPGGVAERYVVGERLGAGGMGVVWAAHDRVLDRPVALKYLHDALLGAAFQARLTEEARAMAKLSHPNVVAVFDVGATGGRMYLVMELVRGVTLARWLETSRDWRAIVGLFRGAGRGLAAAHAAGIVHRDVKPGNILVGDDGRARVADFGIAATVATAAARDVPAGAALTGTPAYVPPERRAGAAADARGDQYAFCVALHEALHGRLPPDDDTRADGERPIPAWLRDVVARGRARDPAARFPSMDAVVAALAGPSRRPWWIAGGVAAAAGGAAIAIALGGGEPDRCTGAAAEIAAVWNDGTRAAVSGHLRELGGFGEKAADQVVAGLARRSTAWADAHTSACRARDRGELTAARHERTLTCLSTARSELAAIVGVLEVATPANLPSALIAASSATSVDDCVDAGAGAPPPPAADAARARELAGAIEAARALALARHPDAALTTARAVADADALGYAPLAARARLVHGIALMTDQPEHAIEPLRLATRAALELGDDALAVEAYARAIYVLGTDPGQVGAPAAGGELGGIAVMEPIAARLGGPGRFARALFFNNAGVVALAAGDRATARRWLERGLAEVRSGARPGDVELANIPANLALVVDDVAAQRALVEEAAASMQRVLGADHPMTLGLVLRAGILLEDPALAEAAITPPCKRYAELHAHQTQMVGECMYELGWLALVRGDDATARPAFLLVAADTLQGPAARAALTLIDGDAAGAAAALDAIGGEKAADPAWWVRLHAADADVLAAIAWTRAGQPGRAAKVAAAAVALLEPLARDVPQPSTSLRLARARALVKDSR